MALHQINTKMNPAFLDISSGGVAESYATEGDLPDATASQGVFAIVDSVQGTGTPGLYLANAGAWSFITALS